MCASVESTLAGVDVVVVCGIIAVVDDQAADCHLHASCSLGNYDGTCQLFEKWQRCKWCG